MDVDSPKQGSSSSDEASDGIKSPADGVNSTASPNTQNAGLSSPQPTPDMKHDLAEPLLQAGWRKFFSKREGRPYFYNTQTRESRWDMPSIHGTVSLGVLTGTTALLNIYSPT